MVTDFSRQFKYIDPGKFSGVKVAVVGVGAVGSHLALQLAQHGLGLPGQGELHVFDMDTVEEHNLPNQAYLLKHLGMRKVDAIKDLIEMKMGFSITTHDEEVAENSRCNYDIRSADYVFLAVDSMAVRKMIFERLLRMNAATKLVVESRMGLTEGMVFTVNPQNYSECEMWNDKWYSDDESAGGGCGGSEAVANTAIRIATDCVSQMLYHFKRSEVDFKIPKTISELQISTAPLGLVGFDFNAPGVVRTF